MPRKVVRFVCQLSVFVFFYLKIPSLTKDMPEVTELSTRLIPRLQPAFQMSNLEKTGWSLGTRLHFSTLVTNSKKVGANALQSSIL